MDIVGYARRFLVVICMMILLVSNIVIPSVFSEAKHGCAPATPPSVAGTLTQPAATAHVVFINEVLTNPGSVWNCSETGTSASTNDVWVEIYNPQNEPLDLYTVHSSLDTGPNTTESYFPVGSAIAAHGFLVIFPEVSAPLFLSSQSSLLRLLINGTLVDQVTLISLVSDTSYARMPDGGDTWQVADAPTIDASNVLPVATPEATKTPKSSSTKTASQDSSTQSDTSTLDGATANPGTQPAWNILSVPETMSPTAETTTQGNISNSAPQVTNTADLPQKVLLTLLAAASLLALLWASRFFRRGKKSSDTPIEAPSIQENKDFSVETVDMPAMPDDHSMGDKKA